jgi:hypothetical protein
VVPRETQLRYTTNSDEVAKIERLEREGKTTEEAIAHLVEQERVAAAKRGVKQVA